MSTTVHNRPRKHGDRSALLADVEYFANELLRCVEELVKVDASGPLAPSWQQAAALTRRIRGLARQETDKQRRKAKQGGEE